jgi:hypothetical protein
MEFLTEVQRDDDSEGTTETTWGMSPRKSPAGGASDVMTYYDIYIIIHYCPVKVS